MDGVGGGGGGGGRSRSGRSSSSGGGGGGGGGSSGSSSSSRAFLATAAAVRLVECTIDEGNRHKVAAIASFKHQHRPLTPSKGGVSIVIPGYSSCVGNSRISQSPVLAIR